MAIQLLMVPVRYSSDALKALARYRRDADRIMAKINSYARDPEARANNVKQLKGKPSRLRLRVRDYRVLFTLEADEMQNPRHRTARLGL